MNRPVNIGNYVRREVSYLFGNHKLCVEIHLRQSYSYEPEGETDLSVYSTFPRNSKCYWKDRDASDYEEMVIKTEEVKLEYTACDFWKTNPEESVRKLIEKWFDDTDYEGDREFEVPYLGDIMPNMERI